MIIEQDKIEYRSHGCEVIEIRSNEESGSVTPIATAINSARAEEIAQALNYALEMS